MLRKKQFYICIYIYIIILYIYKCIVKYMYVTYVCSVCIQVKFLRAYASTSFKLNLIRKLWIYDSPDTGFSIPIQIRSWVTECVLNYLWFVRFLSWFTYACYHITFDWITSIEYVFFLNSPRLQLTCII